LQDVGGGNGVQDGTEHGEAGGDDADTDFDHLPEDEVADDAWRGA